MDFLELMKQNKKLVNDWLNDETIIDYYEGNEDLIKLEFFKSIQSAANSDFVIMTKEQYEKNINNALNSF